MISVDSPYFRDKTVEVPGEGKRAKASGIQLEILDDFHAEVESGDRYGASREMTLSTEILRDLLEGEDFFLYWNPKLDRDIGDLNIQLGDPREKRSPVKTRLFSCYGFTEAAACRIANGMDLLRPYGIPARELSSYYSESGRSYCGKSFQTLEKLSGKKIWIPRHMKKEEKGYLRVMEMYPDEKSKSYVFCRYAFGEIRPDDEHDRYETFFMVETEDKPHRLPKKLRKLARSKAHDMGVTVDSW